MKVVGSNPRSIYWMNIFSHSIVAKKLMFVRKDENKRKRGQGSHFKKLLNKAGFELKWLEQKVMMLTTSPPSKPRPTR